MWFPNRSDKNRPVQAQKRDRSFKFRIKVEEELYYQSSENKGADQLHGYREADLRLCFRLCRLLVFPRGGSYLVKYRYLSAYRLGNSSSVYNVLFVSEPDCQFVFFTTWVLG